MATNQIILGGQIIQADLDMCYPSPTNPRKTFNDESLRELAESIKSTGLAQPITVREMPLHAAEKPGSVARLEIVCGERRWRAHVLAKLPTIECILRDLTDEQVIRIQVLENLQREDLTAIEEAEGFYTLRKQGMSAEQIAQEIGKSREYVYGQLKLLDLIDPVRDAVRHKQISASIAGLIARIPVPEMQLDALALVTERDDYSGETMSFRKAKAMLAERYTRNLAKAPFDPADATLLPEAGACGDCPHKLANQRGNDASANVCTKPPCHEQKRQAWNVRMLNLPADTPRVTVPKAEGAAGPTNWTDYDAAGYRLLASTYHNDPLKRSYADWLRDNDEQAPIAVHVCPVTGDARAVVRIDDLIKAANRIEAKAAATAEQPHLDVVIEERAQAPAKAPATAATEPGTKPAAAPVTLPPIPSSKPKQDEHALATARYRSQLASAIMAEPPMLIGGPLLDLVAHALLDGDAGYIDSDGEAMQAILAALIKRSEGHPLHDSSCGLETIAEALSIDHAEMRAKHFAGLTGSARTSTVRYRHPKNPDISWSGHGRKPQWVLEWINNGGAITDLENPDYAKDAA